MDTAQRLPVYLTDRVGKRAMGPFLVALVSACGMPLGPPDLDAGSRGDLHVALAQCTLSVETAALDQRSYCDRGDVCLADGAGSLDHPWVGDCVHPDDPACGVVGVCVYSDGSVQRAPPPVDACPISSMQSFCGGACGTSACPAPEFFEGLASCIGMSRSRGLGTCVMAVSYTHLRAHETPEHLVCRLLLE